MPCNDDSWRRGVIVKQRVQDMAHVVGPHDLSCMTCENMSILLSTRQQHTTTTRQPFSLFRRVVCISLVMPVFVFVFGWRPAVAARTTKHAIRYRGLYQ